MKTIEERAEEFAEEHWIEDDSIYSAEVGYISGANEQEAITKKEMIDKACKFLQDNIDEKLIIYHNDTWKSLDEFILDFKKAMEE